MVDTARNLIVYYHTQTKELTMDISDFETELMETNDDYARQKDLLDALRKRKAWPKFRKHLEQVLAKTFSEEWAMYAECAAEARDPYAFYGVRRCDF